MYRVEHHRQRRARGVKVVYVYRHRCLASRPSSQIGKNHPYQPFSRLNERFHREVHRTKTTRQEELQHSHSPSTTSYNDTLGSSGFEDDSICEQRMHTHQKRSDKDSTTNTEHCACQEDDAFDRLESFPRSDRGHRGCAPAGAEPSVQALGGLFDGACGNSAGKESVDFRDPFPAVVENGHARSMPSGPQTVGVLGSLKSLCPG